MSEAIPQEITVNVAMDPVTHEDIMRNNFHDGQVLSDRNISVVLPEFADVYKYGVSDTVRGVMQRSTVADNRYDNLPYNFGLLELSGISYHGVETMAFVPFVPRHSLHLFDNLASAAANFHANLIHDSNRSLEIQRSSLRLASIAIQSS